MFGDCYTPTAYNEQIAEGVYTITLAQPEVTQKGGYDCVVIPITIRGHETASPRTWTIFDCLNKYDQSEVTSWNARMTKFFDAFHIPYDDGASDINRWRNHSGEVFIGKDKNGYMHVKYPIVTAVPQPATQPAQQPPHVPQPAQQRAATATPATATTNTSWAATFNPRYGNRQQPPAYESRNNTTNAVSDSPNMDSIPF